MKTIIKIILTTICVFIYCSCNPVENINILDLLIESPFELEFIEQKKGSLQIILTATYRVKGSEAERVENYFNKNFNMDRMNYACCGWEVKSRGSIPITEQFDRKFNAIYEYNSILITMYSDETAIVEREKWNEIPYFYIIVEVADI